ncbi:MAG: hypothetical protein OXI12_13995 [Gammaproteobacteria bacterium]|nr:hypothetical protein [Gammaproteobacteria bacterium]
MTPAQTLALEHPHLLAIEALHPRCATIRSTHSVLLGVQTGWE